MVTAFFTPAPMGVQPLACRRGASDWHTGRKSCTVLTSSEPPKVTMARSARRRAYWSDLTASMNSPTATLMSSM